MHQAQNTQKAGRPKEKDIEKRQKAVVEAAAALLQTKSYEQITIDDVAAAAHISKSTLYSWFGSKLGLYQTLVISNASGVSDALQKLLSSERDIRCTLEDFAARLYTLLTSSDSLALNRAACNDPELASVLLQYGRKSVGPLIENYLCEKRSSGELVFEDTQQAFSIFYGMIMQDDQIRLILSDEDAQVANPKLRAKLATQVFLETFGTNS